MLPRIGAVYSFKDPLIGGDCFPGYSNVFRFRVAGSVLRMNRARDKIRRGLVLGIELQGSFGMNLRLNWLNSNGVRKFQGCFNPGYQSTLQKSTPKEFANAFSVECAWTLKTQGWKPNPGLKFTNAFGV